MTTEQDIHTGAETDVLGAVFKEHVLAQLREAVEIAEGKPAADWDRFRDVLEELVARVEGHELTRLADGHTGGPRRTSRLSCAVFVTSGGEPVTEFLLIPFGEVKVDRPVSGDGFVFTAEHARSAKRWFDRIGRRLAIDYEHQSFDRYNTRPDGLRPAAGWIGKVEIRDDGLWAADVTWTERARELLRSGEYRYFSPVIYWTDQDYTDIAGLGPVALTNDPAMHGVRPLAARRQVGDEAHPPGQGQAADADDATGASLDAQLVPRVELDAAEAEVAVLRQQLAAQDADTFVERGMRLGKILDSTSMDWREDYLRDPERAEERLARAPVLLPPGRVLRVDRDGSLAPVSRARWEYRRHADVYRRWGIEPEDLVAYEQALAADRVRHFGAAR